MLRCVPGAILCWGELGEGGLSVFGHISVRILTRAPRIFGLSLRKNRTLTKDSSCRQCCQGIALDKLSLMPVGIDCAGVLLRRPANRRLRHREMLTLASRRIFTGQVAPATTLLPQAETNSPLLQTYWCRSREQEPFLKCGILCHNVSRTVVGNDWRAGSHHALFR